MRAVVDEALETGYLADAEAAFKTGGISDYFLFPAGRLPTAGGRLNNVNRGNGLTQWT